MFKSSPHSRLRVDRVFAAQLDNPVASLTAADLRMSVDTYPAAFAVRTVRPPSTVMVTG